MKKCKLSYTFFHLIGTLNNLIKQGNDYIGIELLINSFPENSDEEPKEYTLDVYLDSFLMEVICKESSPDLIISVKGRVFKSFIRGSYLHGDCISFLKAEEFHEKGGE